MQQLPHGLLHPPVVQVQITLLHGQLQHTTAHTAQIQHITGVRAAAVLPERTVHRHQPLPNQEVLIKEVLLRVAAAEVTAAAVHPHQGVTVHQVVPEVQELHHHLPAHHLHLPEGEGKRRAALN
jgi:hypothetical protein